MINRNSEKVGWIQVQQALNGRGGNLHVIRFSMKIKTPKVDDTRCSGHAGRENVDSTAMQDRGFQDEFSEHLETGKRNLFFFFLKSSTSGYAILSL